MAELKLTEDQILNLEDRRLMNFFEDSILQNPSLQTTLNNLTAATALLERGLISIYSPKIEVVFSQCKKNYISFGRCSKERFNEEKFADFNTRFKKFGGTLESTFDDLKFDCDLNERARIVDREEVVEAYYNSCYKSYISSRKERNLKLKTRESISKQFE